MAQALYPPPIALHGIAIPYRSLFSTYSTLSRYTPHTRSAPKGRQQMGETGFCKNLRFSAVSCEILRFPAVFCANLRLPNPLIYRASRKSAKICKNLRKKMCVPGPVSPFAVSLLARPDIQTPIALTFACMQTKQGGVSHLKLPSEGYRAIGGYSSYSIAISRYTAPLRK